MSINFDKLANLILASISAESQAGVGIGRFIYDHRSPVSELNYLRGRDERDRKARTTAMWLEFYEVAGSTKDASAKPQPETLANRARAALAAYDSTPTNEDIDVDTASEVRDCLALLLRFEQ